MRKEKGGKMEIKFKGQVHKYGDNINTDVIIPTRYCTTIEPSELAVYCLHDLDAAFAQRLNPGDILVAGYNFGCGSSREVAPLAIQASGISCIIAASFARIFYRNAINIGLPIIECPRLVHETSNGHWLEINFDKSCIYSITTGESYSFQTAGAEIQEIIRSGGLINYIKKTLEKKRIPIPRV